jgi:hypothetical protein
LLILDIEKLPVVDEALAVPPYEAKATLVPVLATYAGTFTVISLVFAFVLSDSLVTVNTRLTLAVSDGGEIAPYVLMTTVLLEL